jgi:catechol 2,3-dioxygenase-like lactoylglutathione lyase family enzyme
VFDHVTITASDLAASTAFYATVRRTLGDEPEDFRLRGGDAVTRRLHIAFAAPSRAHVDAFWQAGIAAGYRDDGAPGPRPQYTPDYYGGFLLDPDGNSAEAVHHETPRRPGRIDHLWLRTRDVAAVKRFYLEIAPHAGLRLGVDKPDHVQLVGRASSFSFVTGTPTEHALLAFPGAVEPFGRDPDGNEVGVRR